MATKKTTKKKTTTKRRRSGTATAVEGEPNVQYVRRRPQLVKETGKMKVLPVKPEDVPTYRIGAGKEFKLPSGEEQLRGFYHEDAATLLRQWPKDFKRPGKGRVVKADTAENDKTEGGSSNE